MIEIEKQREIVAETILSKHRLLAVVGPCALHCDPLLIEEGLIIRDFGERSENVETLHRIPVWKPRTLRPGEKPWEGVDTTEPNEALVHLQTENDNDTKIAIEVNSLEHILRYSGLISMAWIGSRNAGSRSLIRMAAFDHDLSRIPVGVKNDLRGDICSTVEAVNQINLSRDRGNPAVMIFRGGTNTLTPEEWEAEYHRAYDLTDGTFIVDVAHGSEIAHDHDNLKSVNGQIKAAEHVVRLAQEGLMPSGIMIEASDIHIEDISRRTDPNMPLDLALGVLGELQKILKNKGKYYENNSNNRGYGTSSISICTAKDSNRIDKKEYKSKYSTRFVKCRRIL